MDNRLRGPRAEEEVTSLEAGMDEASPREILGLNVAFGETGDGTRPWPHLMRSVHGKPVQPDRLAR